MWCFQDAISHDRKKLNIYIHHLFDSVPMKDKALDEPISF